MQGHSTQRAVDHRSASIQPKALVAQYPACANRILAAAGIIEQKRNRHYRSPISGTLMNMI